MQKPLLALGIVVLLSSGAHAKAKTTYTKAEISLMRKALVADAAEYKKMYDEAQAEPIPSPGPPQHGWATTVIRAIDAKKWPTQTPPKNKADLQKWTFFVSWTEYALSSYEGGKYAKSPLAKKLTADFYKAWDIAGAKTMKSWGYFKRDVNAEADPRFLEKWKKG